MTTTTTIGTWVNYGDHWNVSVEATVADAISGGDADWRERMEASGAFDNIAAAYRTAIDAVLPEGIALCGNEFIADADTEFEPEHTEAIDGIDLGAIVERYDVDA